jgi:hypothetical protein
MKVQNKVFLELDIRAKAKINLKEIKTTLAPLQYNIWGLKN